MGDEIFNGLEMMISGVAMSSFTQEDMVRDKVAE
jgi:hypothetical protein